MSLMPFGSNIYNPWWPTSSWTTDIMPTPFGFGTDVDRYLKNVDRDFWRMKREMDRAFRNMDRTFSSELTFMPSRPASMVEHYSLMNPIQVDPQGNRTLSVNFDLRSFKPEEINVTLNTNERTINVEANHEVKDKDHYIKRGYSRKVLIPDPKLDLSKIELKSCLTNEGVLCVEAPLPKLAIEEKPQQPTTMEGVRPITVKTV